jgi:hypothetical protein
MTYRVADWMRGFRGCHRFRSRRSAWETGGVGRRAPGGRRVEHGCGGPRANGDVRTTGCSRRCQAWSPVAESRGAGEQERRRTRRKKQSPNHALHFGRWNDAAATPCRTVDPTTCATPPLLSIGLSLINTQRWALFWARRRRRGFQVLGWGGAHVVNL